MARFFPALILCFCLTFQGYSQSNWQKHKSPISADLHNIFFVSDSVGWITSHKTGAILHTRDAGKNWFVQTQMDSIFFEDIFFLEGFFPGLVGAVFGFQVHEFGDFFIG